MIELVSDARCIRCDVCVKVCPTNVFSPVLNQAPIIARQEDCQTCFMCELYCPTDALFVAPDADHAAWVDERALVDRELLGSYRAAVGWGAGRTRGASRDQSFRVLTATATPPTSGERADGKVAHVSTDVKPAAPPPRAAAARPL